MTKIKPDTKAPTSDAAPNKKNNRTVVLDHRIPETPEQFLRRFAGERAWWKFTSAEVNKFRAGDGAKIAFKGTHLISPGTVCVRLVPNKSDTFEWFDITELSDDEAASPAALKGVSQFFVEDLTAFGGPGVTFGDLRNARKKT